MGVTERCPVDTSTVTAPAYFRNETLLKQLMWALMLPFIPGLIIYFGVALEIIVLGAVAVAFLFVMLVVAVRLLARLTRLLGITPHGVEAFFNRITPYVRRIKGQM